MDAAEAARRRRARRRRLHQRQTIIFGGLLTALLVIALLALSMWRGVVPSPFSRPFSTPDPDDVAVAMTPCPPTGATPVPFGEITANVYNSTNVSGLAGQTASALSDQGIVVPSSSNYSGEDYTGTAQIITGPRGVSAAYTVAALIADSQVVLDQLRNDETIDVVLGVDFDTALIDASELDPEAEFEAPLDCVPVPAATDDVVEPEVEIVEPEDGTTDEDDTEG